jgi:hypothetical protein
MAILDHKPLTLPAPLREEPARVLQVGKSCVLLELVIRAYQRGASPQEIVRMYDSLALSDVSAVIAYYLAHPGPSKEELLARARNTYSLLGGLATSSGRSAICQPTPRQV